jgi:hypothetical protein
MDFRWSLLTSAASGFADSKVAVQGSKSSLHRRGIWGGNRASHFDIAKCWSSTFRLFCVAYMLKHELQPGELPAGRGQRAPVSVEGTSGGGRRAVHGGW